MVIYKRIIRFWEEHPLTSILFLAVFFRLLAVVVAKGWGMLDDHFLVIESSQSWVDGHDSDNWLPGSPNNIGPTGHSFFYAGLHFILFTFFRFIHLEDPQAKMVIVRFLHATWSMITVYFGYKITLKLGGERSARLAGLLLAVYWFLPWASVRNMVEVVCIPFLILAIWRLTRKSFENNRLIDFFIAGLFLGLAFNIRTQTAFFSIGVGVVFLLQRRWKEVLILTIGAVTPLILIQGIIDLFIWGKPFAEIIGYITGNVENATSYFVMPWYNYFLVVFGFLLPPVSFFLFFGYLFSLLNWKKYLLIFLPIAFFFIFHSMFPNKQERFILPILPFIIILGTIGWQEFLYKTKVWLKRRKWLHRTWIFSWIMNLIRKLIWGSWSLFWVINLVLLLFITVTYSKKARVETMIYLSKYKNINYLLVADAGNNPELFPKFYLNQWPNIYDHLLKGETTDSLLIRASKTPFQKQPRFILFSAEKDLQIEIVKARRSFPFIVFETKIEPGFIDKFVKWLNPINKNRTVYIYRNLLFYPQKIN